MSRSLERDFGAAGTNTFVSRLTVPTGHKYEVTAASWSSATAAAGEAYLLVLPFTGGAIFVDDVVIGAGRFCLRVPETSIVLYAGDVIQAGVIAAGGTNWSVWLDYVDVDYGS